ncbi:sensor histidine kinase [Planctobacterium marinum]|uniref:Histidine kinase domain-containing protein n=1 Tax=Planctobacterium marinum TaxID=1631968 RepID=A0AA48KPF4_9ALTE|nr:hypothetical protein MACH26_08790 [Planctobacterium marinum]
MMQLSIKHKIFITLFLCFLHLLPALNEWIQLGFPADNVLLISAPIWWACFYVGPFWLYYAALKFQFIRDAHIIWRGHLFVILMFIGISTVNVLHKLHFSHFNIDIFERFFSALIWGIFLFVLWESLQLYRRYTQEKLLREQMQMLHLNHQLNPHFLFNGLNTISALMFQNPDKADEVLHKFADILRYAIDKKDMLIDLKTELEISRFYLDVEKARFGDNLQVLWQVDEQLLTQKVPPLLLQPLLENCLKHAGVRPLQVSLKLYQQENALCIEIQDNGKGFKQTILDKQQEGVGLGLIRERLSLLQMGHLELSNHNGALAKISVEAAC